MLRRFSVRNYKNFRDTVTLDFTRTHDYRFNNTCIKERLLNKILLTGKNGSGKTNFAYGLFDIVHTLTDNIAHPIQMDEGSFLNGMSDSKEASFEYEFQNGDEIILYTYRKTSPRRITYERMMKRGELIFEFDHGSGKYDTAGLKKINAVNLNLQGMNGNISALRVIANNTIQNEGSPVHFVMDFVNRMLYYRFGQDGDMFIGLFKNTTHPEQYIIEKGLVKEFQNFVNEMTGMDMELDVFEGPSSKSLVQKFPGKSLYFSPIASSGTKALELYYFCRKSFDAISFLYIDNFDAYYHFELSKDILQYTIDNVRAQAMMSTHNTYLANNDLMRPDCCLKIDGGRIASYADSTSRELREGHNIEKMLRNGEFDD